MDSVQLLPEKNQYMRLFISWIVFAFSMIVLMFNGMSRDVILNSDLMLGHLNAPDWNFEILKNDTGGWFYEIKSDEKLIVRQENIPAIPGNYAFQDSIQASRVAELMMDKMENGIFPPSISIKELDNLQITY